MLSESEVQQQVMIEAAKHGIILMRNNSGAFTDSTGRSVRYGLGNDSKKRNDKIKSSDLIGIWPVVITQEMVGQRFGIFFAVEVKEESWRPSFKDKRETAQRVFIDWVKSLGGVAGFANSVDSFRALLGR